MTLETFGKATELHAKIGVLHQIGTAKHIQLCTGPGLVDKYEFDITNDWPELRKCIADRKEKLLKEFDAL